jgi:Fe-S cluster assembly protein SufB
MKSSEISNYLDTSYKYGFITEIEKEFFPKGINSSIVKFLALKKKEPKYLSLNRLKSYKFWKQMYFPNWIEYDIPKITFSDIQYYSIPKKNSSSLEEINPEILEVFTKLGIPLSEQKQLANVAIDAVFDSVSISTTYKEKLAKYGVIFSSISLAIKYYLKLVKKFFGKVVSLVDNFFTALNSSIFSDGSFCYIGQNIKSPLELSSYFRINDKSSGQFERTLIIAENNSEVSYLEGCTAPEYKETQLHAAVVELITFKNGIIKYSTIQNWYGGNSQGFGGIYNLVTKRGLCSGKLSKILWTQVEVGSSITWKYPSCILLGEESIGEFFSVALTKNFQQADTGTKMYHLGKKTKSKIISKGISSDFSQNSYRGLVKFSKTAFFSRNFSQCDSFLLGDYCTVFTYPYLDVYNKYSIIEHEAKISKLNDDQLFYLQQRGISIESAIGIIINGFCKDILVMLPLEFALEANKLLSLKLEYNIG